MKIHLSAPGRKNGKNLIQIDRWDVWSFDDTFARIIVPCLELLRSTSNGYPSVFMDHFDRYEQYHFEFMELDDDNDIGAELWDQALAKMIWSFQQTIEDDTAPLPSSADYDVYNERLQEGLDLFAKYYRNLWD
jgi:hypothetical protein